MNKLSSVDHCLDIMKSKLTDSLIKTAKTMFQLSYINSNSAIKPELCHRFDLKQIGTDFDKKDSL